MHEQNRPTWNDVLGSTRASLTAARAQLEDAREHLQSDWRSVGTALSDGEVDASRRALELIGHAQGVIDEAKNAVVDAHR